MENWQVVEAFIIPLIVAGLARHKSPELHKAIAMFVVCIIAAVINQYFKGELVFTITNFGVGFSDAIRLVAIAIPLYYGWYKPTGIAPWVSRMTG